MTKKSADVKNRQKSMMRVTEVLVVDTRESSELTQAMAHCQVKINQLSAGKGLKFRRTYKNIIPCNPRRTAVRIIVILNGGPNAKRVFRLKKRIIGLYRVIVVGNHKGRIGNKNFFDIANHFSVSFEGVALEICRIASEIKGV